jgi:hypothetical protein
MLWLLLGIIAGLLIAAVMVTVCMSNPYKLYIVVGAKGSGKTAYLARLCEKYEKKKIGNIYSNCDIGLPLPDRYWEFEYPKDSMLLIDEIGIVHDNRKFKQFEAACNEFYKYQRKNKLIIVATSQTMDVDKKIRVLTDYIMVARLLLCFCFVLRYRHAIVLADDPETGGQRLTDTEKLSGIESLFFVPSTFNLFNTLKKARNVAEKEDV